MPLFFLNLCSWYLHDALKTITDISTANKKLVTMDPSINVSQKEAHASQSKGFSLRFPVSFFTFKINGRRKDGANCPRINPNSMIKIKCIVFIVE